MLPSALVVYFTLQVKAQVILSLPELMRERGPGYPAPQPSQLQVTKGSSIAALLLHPPPHALAATFVLRWAGPVWWIAAR